jgi:hypothetical protein
MEKVLDLLFSASTRTPISMEDFPTRFRLDLKVSNSPMKPGL